MNPVKLKALLSSQESKYILKGLLEIRTKTIKTESGVDALLEENFIPVLINLLTQTNSKILDITLSILANLLQEDLARRQLRASGGLTRLMNIIQNLEESSVLCRFYPQKYSFN